MKAAGHFASRVKPGNGRSVGAKDARLKRAAGWIKIDLAAPPSDRDLAAWVAESHALVAGSGAKKPVVKKAAAKKTAAKKPASRKRR